VSSCNCHACLEHYLTITIALRYKYGVSA